jgi:hypothetical protein
MGITGLWPLLEPASESISLESLEGQRVAVGKCPLFTFPYPV